MTIKKMFPVIIKVIGWFVLNILIYVLLTALFLLLISLIPLKVYVRYLKQNHDDELIIKVYLFKWTGVILKLPVIKLEQYLPKPALKIEGEVEDINNTLPLVEKGEEVYLPALNKMLGVLKKVKENIEIFKPSILYLLSKIRFKDFKWKTKFGIGDPALTGLLVGTAWSIKNIVFLILSKYVHVNNFKPDFCVTPYFKAKGFSSDISCIFDIRIGHIMITGLNLVVRRFYKGRKI